MNTDLNIGGLDAAIFIGFLVINVVFGLASSRGIKNVKEYAIGNKDFSTAAITATIVATWISGGIFFTVMSESYNNGLYFMWTGLGNVICLLLIGYFFAPRLAEFVGKISIAEAMGELYGKPVRIITAIAGFIGVSGIIAMQLKISGRLFEYCFEVPSAYGVIVGGTIVTLYSCLGGIKSVTFTDVIQFFTFGTIIPTITLFVLSTLSSIDLVTNTLSSNQIFDYKEVFDFSRPKSFYYLFLFLCVATPDFNPAIFQRIAMAKNTKQIRQSFIIAGFVCLCLIAMVYWMSILLLSMYPNIPANNVVKHLILDYSYVGLKGLTLAGIMAAVMSTADSYINSTAVLIVHDFCKPLGINIIKNELTFSRIASLFIGVFSMILCLYSTSLLQLVIATFSFYMPIVTVPFIMSVLGFRSSGKSVLIGMAGGFIAVACWEIFLKQNMGIDGLVPGMAANLIFLLGSHYLLKQPGGWVGIKDYGPLREARRERKAKIRNFINGFKNFSFPVFLRRNSPSGDAIYPYLGFFCMIAVFANMHTIPTDIRATYAPIIDFMYPTVLFTATLLMSYPLWLPSWKSGDIMISILWNFAIFYVLVCVGFMLVIINKFAHLQLTAFMINLIVIAILAKWQLALAMITLGVILTTQFFKYYVGVDDISQQYATAHFEMAYLLILISGVLMAFVKPKQRYQEITEEKNEHLLGRIDAKDKEVQEALALKGEFIRNVTHEYHAPMTGIMSMAEILVDSYHKLNDAQRLSAAEVIFKSSHKLKTFDDNIATLSRLSKPNYQLKKENTDLSILVEERLETCRNLYTNAKEQREFTLEITENLIANVDKIYITQLIDNLIINAINYCSEGNIHITLAKNKNNIYFGISDTGIGIPQNELSEIFEPFTVSSKTKTQAGGRGVGLTICKRILEVHQGTIKAESNGKKGAVFTAILPCDL